MRQLGRMAGVAVCAIGMGMLPAAAQATPSSGVTGTVLTASRPTRRRGPELIRPELIRPKLIRRSAAAAAMGLVLVGATIAGSAPTAAAGRVGPANVAAPGCAPFARTELFFGTAKPDGTAVTEEEFDNFLDGEITPRFPAGLTLLSALGQFRGSGGAIVQEQSKIVIFAVPGGIGTRGEHRDRRDPGCLRDDVPAGVRPARR